MCSILFINRNYATLGTCYSVWYAGANAPAYQTSHPPRVTNTKCHINTVISADNGHIIAQNMYRKEINKLRKTEPSWLYLQDHSHNSLYMEHPCWCIKIYKISNHKQHTFMK